MKYVVLFILMLPRISNAQLKVSGFGRYLIGITTPDSLQRIDFKEEDESYVKGTLTLPCTHIRIFTADTAEIAGIFVANISLFFYDNRLFKLSCDYNEELKKAFIVKYGTGIPKPNRYFSSCIKRKDKPLAIWGEIWQNDDILALAVYTKGYNADCEMEEAARFIISSQKMTALASDCELKNSPQFVEEFNNMPNGHQEKQRSGN